ncbi:MAG: hypothetical protein FJ215_03180 [Ignavibacteria bacterium]|nr:hypothetical protein [Ignavibacteria bacterium]
MAQAFREPRGKVYLLYGDNLVFQFSHRIGASLAGQGGSIAVVDGANRFDVHAVVRFAQERRLDPEALLDRLYISRGFTCYQMEAAVAERLPGFLKQIGSHTAFIFGLLDTLYDEQAPLRDVRAILKRVVSTLNTMKDEGISILLTCSDWRVHPEERNQLFAELKRSVDRVYRLEMGEEKTPQLYLERERHDAAVPRPLKKGENTDGKNRTNVHKHY